MKTICRILLATLITLKCLNAQFETTLYLYDTINEGPYISQENGGYNFIFKTKEEGTMVSTRGQVVNPSMDYQIFNHFYINEDGSMDSLLSVPIRADVNHHYTMYKRGLPKLIQYRVGTSNDPSLDKILSKYPLIKSERYNDEALSINKINFDQGNYELTSQTYDRGEFKENQVTSKLAPESEEGTWVLKHHYVAPNIDIPVTLTAYGRKIQGDKTRKYNDLKDFLFIALDKTGTIIREEEISFETAYEFQNSGIIHDIDGVFSGFYMSMVESSGRANKEYNASVQKILFFDKKGYYDGETDLLLPFEPKGKEVADQVILKIVKTNNEKKIYLYTPGVRKANVKEGIYAYRTTDESSELVRFKTIEEIKVPQDERNNFEGGPAPSKDFKYAVSLENGNLLCIASENGTDLQFLQITENGEVTKRSAGYLLNDIGSQKNLLTFEYLNKNKLLIISKVGYEKAVYTSYAIYDARTGVLETIQPKEDIATIHSVRNGDQIMVFGSSFEDEKNIHMVLYKLDSKVQSLTSLDQD